MNRDFNNICAKNHVLFHTGFLTKVGQKLPAFFFYIHFYVFLVYRRNIKGGTQMFIKKVIVTWDAAYRVYPSLRILFYGQVGNLFESGSAISSTDTKAETDNFIITTSRGAGNYPTYYPIYGISTEMYKYINSACASGYCFRSDYTSDNITFFIINDVNYT